MENLFQSWITAKNSVKKAQEELLEIESRLYVKYQNELKEKGLGTSNFIQDNLKLTIVQKETMSVDQKELIRLGYNNHKAFKAKYELDKKYYKNMDMSERQKLNQFITTKPSKPSFEVKEIQND